MIERRDVLKSLAGLASVALIPRMGLAAPGKVRVTLVRWPYT
jgi:hypothetical protein